MSLVQADTSRGGSQEPTYEVRAGEPLLAMALVIRDERRFLAEHLAYHRAMGVGPIYVFADRCTDGSVEIARSFPGVEVFERNRRREDRFMSSHQTRCLAEALELSRAAGADWLLHVDPDEFARGDDPHEQRWRAWRAGWVPGDLEGARLTAMLSGLGPEIEQVVLEPRDVIPVPKPAGTAFYRQHHVQGRGSLSRRILDPTTGQVVRYRKRLGHYKGKAIVRVTADVVPESAHRWKHATREAGLKTVRRGIHYHYIAVDGELWLNKHQKFAEYPKHWDSGGAVRFPKQAWKEASVGMSLAEARDYFDRWVAVPASRLRFERLLGRVYRDGFVERVLREIGMV